MKQLKVLMIGPARTVKGGMTTVVNNYYMAKLDEKVSLRYVETINDKNIISKFIQEKKGFREFKKNIINYDLVHVHMASRRSTFRKGKYIEIAKKHGKKVILHIHGAEYKKFYSECSTKEREYIKRILDLSDVVVVLSKEWKDFFDEIVKDTEKVVILYNAVVLPNDFEKDTNSRKILFMGRIGQRKGIYDLIEVVEKIAKEYKDIHLYIGGDGEVQKLQRIISEKGMQNNISYIGWITEQSKIKYLKECSYYILPSYNEGMPMSILEGMAYKNITISTNVGGIPQVIENMKNGIIIEPGDKNALYEKLVMLLKDKNVREKLSTNARKTIEEKFNISNNIDELLDIYNKGVNYD